MRVDVLSRTLSVAFFGPPWEPLIQVISAGCHDVLCNQCAVETHSTGNRQDRFNLVTLGDSLFKHLGSRIQFHLLRSYLLYCNYH